MTTWHDVRAHDVPPTHKADEWDKWRSKPVLVFTTHGTIIVATLEHWEDTDTPEWYSNCSEHWDLRDTVTHWTELPDAPK